MVQAVALARSSWPSRVKPDNFLQLPVIGLRGQGPSALSSEI